MSDWTPGPGCWHWPEEEDDEEDDERAEEAARWGTPQDTRVPGGQPLDTDTAAYLAGLLEQLATYLMFDAVRQAVPRGSGAAAEGDANRLFAAAWAVRTLPHTLDSAETRILELRLFSRLGREAREVIIEWIASTRLPDP